MKALRVPDADGAVANVRAVDADGERWAVAGGQGDWPYDTAAIAGGVVDEDLVTDVPVAAVAVADTFAVRW